MCLGHREDGARPCQHIEEEEALGRATQEGVKALVCNAWGGSSRAHLHLEEEALQDVARSRSSISSAHGEGKCSRKRGCCGKPKVYLAGRWKRHLGRRSLTSPVGRCHISRKTTTYGRLAGIHGDIYASPRDHICASLRNWALPIADPLFKTSLQFAEDAYALVLQWRCMHKWTCRLEIGVGLSLFKWL
uniref:Uncharacterized protein n=1 Tax=Oryza sativa subsp. japonica TaxID=39947 RepID=Q6ZAR2_ORYSJ|nr:hypothetical protein [Oryza sativa Japonica Group]BAD03321.1 hypothetical protein [Oryza sativa Japonica Group]